MAVNRRADIEMTDEKYHQVEDYLIQSNFKKINWYTAPIDFLISKLFYFRRWHATALNQNVQSVRYRRRIHCTYPSTMEMDHLYLYFTIFFIQDKENRKRYPPYGPWYDYQYSATGRFIDHICIYTPLLGARQTIIFEDLIKRIVFIPTHLQLKIIQESRSKTWYPIRLIQYCYRHFIHQEKGS